MKYIPHKYQQFCTQYIINNSIAALFLDMGLGKTVITLTAIKELILSQKINKALIIAPLRVARDVWPAEIEKWDHLKTDISISLILGTAKRREKATLAEANIYVINADNVSWLVEFYKNNNKKWDFDLFVVDELSLFKNHKSKKWKALRSVAEFTKRRIGLTGTPASNGLMDLFGEIGILDMGERFGKYITYFRKKYCFPLDVNKRTGIVYKWGFKSRAEEHIYQKIEDITVSMKALDYLDMPKKISNIHFVRLGKKEREQYQFLKLNYLLPFKDTTVDAKSAAVLTQKLQQLANGAVYDEEGNVQILHNRKLEALEDVITEANGHNILCIYNFKHDRDRIFEYFKKQNLEIRDIRENEDIEAWNEGKIQLGLLHPAAGGHGLNLQKGGHIVVWFSLTWNLDYYNQVNARLWRQGQKERVNIQHLVAENTVDERIYNALVGKDKTQERVINAVKAEIAEM